MRPFECWVIQTCHFLLAVLQCMPYRSTMLFVHAPFCRGAVQHLFQDGSQTPEWELLYRSWASNSKSPSATQLVYAWQHSRTSHRVRGICPDEGTNDTSSNVQTIMACSEVSHAHNVQEGKAFDANNNPVPAAGDSKQSQIQDAKTAEDMWQVQLPFSHPCPLARFHFRFKH